MEPGVYYDMPVKTYRQLDALNQSTLKAFAPNPQAWRDGLPQREGAFFDWGDLFESLLFEGSDHWQKLFACLTPEVEAEILRHARARAGDKIKGFSKRLGVFKDWAAVNEGEPDEATQCALLDLAREKEGAKIKGFSKSLGQYRAWAEAQSKAGKEIIDEAFLNSCKIAVKRAEAEPNIESLLSLGGVSQVAIIWRDPVTDLLCKGLIDWVPNELACLVDCKTTKDVAEASPEEAKWRFARSCRKYGYDMQAAFYLDGWALAHSQAGLEQDVRTGWLFIASGNTKPWSPAAWRAPESMIETGARKYRRALDLWKECHETEHFPGLTTDEHWPELPSLKE